MLMLAGNPAAAGAADTSGAVQARDVAATLVYLRAEIHIEHAVMTNMPASRAAVAALQRRVQSGCPNVLAHAPRSKQLADTTVAVYLSAFATVLHPDRETLEGALARIEPLRWSNGRLMRLVAQQRRLEQAEALRHEPDLCTAAREWAASSYQRLPASIAALDRAFRRIIAISSKALNGGPGIQQLLQPYETTKGQRLAKLLAKLEGEEDALHLKALIDRANRTLLGELGLRRSR